MASLGVVTMSKRCTPRFHAERPGQWVEIFYERSIFAKTDFLEGFLCPECIRGSVTLWVC